PMLGRRTPTPPRAWFFCGSSPIKHPISLEPHQEVALHLGGGKDESEAGIVAVPQAKRSFFKVRREVGQLSRRDLGRGFLRGDAAVRENVTPTAAHLWRYHQS